MKHHETPVFHVDLYPPSNLTSHVEGKVYTMAPNGVLFDPPNQAAWVVSLKYHSRATT